MSTILITFLGKSEGYAAIPYVFPDGTATPDESNFHLTLHDHVKPERTLILGTPTSSWDTLFQRNGQTPEEHFPSRIHLRSSVKENDGKKTSDQKDLSETPEWQALSEFLSTEYPGAEIGLIPYGRTEEEQITILRSLADAVNPEETLYLDITHGLRHLPMLVVLAALYLQQTKNVKIQAIYYGASELLGLDEAEGAPVIDLKGLLKIASWVNALSQFQKDGDYGVFAPLLAADGVQQTELLSQAAFLERNQNISQAGDKIRTFSKSLNQLSGLSQLFEKHLTDSLAWHTIGHSNPYHRQLDRARFFLDNGDFLRASVFALEGLVSKNMDANWYDYTAREEARKKLSGPDFHQLRMLRNLLAHGSIKMTQREILSWTKDKNTLDSEFRKLLKRVF